MSKHTPGPWALRGRTVRGPHPKDPKGRTRIVAKAIWDRGTYVDESEANARLIAAAPVMLDALERVKATGVSIGEVPQWMVDSAIAKAKGEQQ